jgi:hypothetical protein
VPASAVDAAPNGVPILVTNGSNSWGFGTLSKEGIR